MMDNQNITIEEYIRLEEEKAQKRRKVFNCDTTKYGKIWYDEDVHDLRSVETEFPAIVFKDNLTSNETLFCEPMVSSLNNNEIDFRISIDQSDDEEYTVVFDKNSFSYKIIYANDLTTDSENDIEKVNVPSFPSPKPKPQHIDEFDLKEEASLFEYDEVEQNVLYFNNLFPFKIIYPNDLKSGKDNDDNEIDIIQLRVEIFVSHAWKRLFKIREPLVQEFILEFFSTCRIDTLGLHTTKEMAEDGFGAYWLGSERVIPDIGDLRGYWIEISSDREFFRSSPFYTYIKDPLPLIDMGELVKLNIYMEVRDDWAWIAQGAERQPVVTAAAPGDAEDAPDVDEDAQTVSAPIHAPPPSPPAAGRTMPQRLGRLEEEIQGLRQDVRSLWGRVERSMTDQGRFFTWMVSCMTQLMKASGRPHCKEIDDVGEVSTIWKSRSVGVLKSQDGCSTHILAHKLNLENLPSKISGEFLILILLIPVFNSSRLLRYAKSKPNGKLIYNSIMNGSYVRRMIPEPGDPYHEVAVAETFHEQTDDELTEKEVKQIEADDQSIQIILMGLPEDIYAAIDSCETA
ncbi:hypothetical protein Tco_1303983 [Tanacetum coccineum]